MSDRRSSEPGRPADTSAPQRGWQAQNKYRTLFDSIDEGFCVIEVLFADGRAVDYRFLEANPAFARQTGLVDAVGQRMRELEPAHEEHWFRIYGEIAIDRQGRRFEAQAAALHRWYDVYAFPVGDPGEHLVAILFNDVSMRKRAEQESARASRRKDEFIATLAHELRNPLAPLRSALDLLERSTDRLQALDAVRPIMQRQIEHLTALVDDLLDFNRISRGLVALQRQPTELAAVVRHAVDTVTHAAAARHQRLDCRLPDAPVHVLLDPVRITQMIGNLLLNEIKFTPERGRILLEVEARPATIVIAIRDTGIGIPGDRLDDIFELFAQLQPSDPVGGGLGIGLALARQIAVLHGGQIRADSDGPGRGSTFTVELPRLAISAAATTAAPGAESPVPSQRIVVVDDNRDAAQSLSLLLEVSGHEVWTVFDGQQAIDSANRLSPDLMLIDIGMPDIDGLQVARRIRALPSGSDIRLVALTGWGQDEDRAASRAAGFDAHLVKPVDLAALNRTLTAG